MEPLLLIPTHGPTLIIDLHTWTHPCYWSLYMDHPCYCSLYMDPPLLLTPIHRTTFVTAPIHGPRRWSEAVPSQTAPKSALQLMKYMALTGKIVQCVCGRLTSETCAGSLPKWLTSLWLSKRSRNLPRAAGASIYKLEGVYSWLVGVVRVGRGLILGI